MKVGGPVVGLAWPVVIARATPEARSPVIDWDRLKQPDTYDAYDAYLTF